MSLEDPSGEALCLACGLCCQGIWFPYVKLKPDEVETAILHEFPLERVDDKVIFHQPCSKHKGGKCSAYSTWRPSACVKFSCRLLDSFVNGDVPFADALDHVKTARGLADELRSEFGHVKGGLRGDEFVACLHDEPSSTDVEEQALTPKTKLNAVALNLYYAKYFKRSKTETSG